MNYEAIQMANLLDKLEAKFNVDANKVQMLRMVVDCWAMGGSMKVTDMLKNYQRTSRATTHRVLKELVSSKLLREQQDTNDRRVRYLMPGAKFDRYIRTIGEML